MIMFVFGFFTGVTALILAACVKAASDADDQEEERMRRAANE